MFTCVIHTYVPLQIMIPSSLISPSHSFRLLLLSLLPLLLPSSSSSPSSPSFSPFLCNCSYFIVNRSICSNRLLRLPSIQHRILKVFTMMYMSLHPVALETKMGVTQGIHQILADLHLMGWGCQRFETMHMAIGDYVNRVWKKSLFVWKGWFSVCMHKPICTQHVCPMEVEGREGREWRWG